jgi:hypothetical protein
MKRHLILFILCLLFLSACATTTPIPQQEALLQPEVTTRSTLQQEALPQLEVTTKPTPQQEALPQLEVTAKPTPQQEALLQLEASRPITCSEGQDCEVKWGRAFRWVQDNSRWNIRTANDTLITTEGPRDTTDAGYEISKDLTDKGIYSISFHAWCGNRFGCFPSISELQVSFVTFVKGPMKTPPAVIEKDATTEKTKFGARIANTNSSAANILGMKEPKGVIIISVVKDSVAFSAGLKQGDAILRFGDKIINDVQDVQTAVAKTKPGSSIPVTIWRSGPGEIVVLTQF